jgi:hypothetical protein
MKTKPPPLAYVKLFNLLHAIRDIPEFPKLDVVEETLLCSVSDALSAGNPLSVVSAMQSVLGASA